MSPFNKLAAFGRHFFLVVSFAVAAGYLVNSLVTGTFVDMDKAFLAFMAAA